MCLFNDDRENDAAMLEIVDVCECVSEDAILLTAAAQRAVIGEPKQGEAWRQLKKKVWNN